MPGQRVAFLSFPVLLRLVCFRPCGLRPCGPCGGTCSLLLFGRFLSVVVAIATGGGEVEGRVVQGASHGSGTWPYQAGRDMASAIEKGLVVYEIPC